MSSPVSSEGNAPFDVPGAGKLCYTWYKVFGELSKDCIPLVAVHGGPGAGHDYLLTLKDLTSQHDVPVVLYDQLGCARSTALPEKKGDERFWTVGLFEDELTNLIKHLGITDFDLYGHSWGGMLASVYAAKRPAGLRKLILHAAPASVELNLQGSKKLRKQLPAEAQEALDDGEAKGDFHSPAYQDACMEFYKRFLCRLDPWPQEVVTSLGYLEQDPTVYETMYGPSELVCTGVLRHWSAIPVLHRIQNTTLVINGEFDETTDLATAPYFENISKAKWITIPNASHMSMWEQRQRFTSIVATFLQSEP